MSDTTNQIHEVVREHYGLLAVSGGSCCGEGDCCGVSAADAALHASVPSTTDVDLNSLYGKLYTADTSWLPQEATGLSLGCGDPITLAALAPGQTVLDLGSGGGIDAFMAARQVGPTGHGSSCPTRPRARPAAARGTPRGTRPPCPG